MDEDFGEQLRSAVSLFVHAAREATDVVTPSQIETMGLLARDGALSIAELARRRGVRHQSQSATTVELRETGLVDRIPDPDDRRGWRIALTPAGNRAITASRQRRARWIAEASAGLGPEDLAVLARVPGILVALAASNPK
jgi:DNA-binding MarR family transcriptional regulator